MLCLAPCGCLDPDWRVLCHLVFSGLLSWGSSLEAKASPQLLCRTCPCCPFHARRIDVFFCITQKNTAEVHSEKTSEYTEKVLMFAQALKEPHICKININSFNIFVVEALLLASECCSWIVQSFHWIHCHIATLEPNAIYSRADSSSWSAGIIEK